MLIWKLFKKKHKFVIFLKKNPFFFQFPRNFRLNFNLQQMFVFKLATYFYWLLCMRNEWLFLFMPLTKYNVVHTAKKQKAQQNQKKKPLNNDDDSRVSFNALKSWLLDNCLKLRVDAHQIPFGMCTYRHVHWGLKWRAT